MNKTKIEWVKNPDGTQGYTWNPITGCLNHIDGMCKGGGFPCYAHRLANGRLRKRYLANTDIAPRFSLPNSALTYAGDFNNPFWPRLWEDRLEKARKELYRSKPKGIFPCDMSDLFGIGIPEEWTNQVMAVIEERPQHRFYLLTKQPQNLIKFSPFPENCWVGVTATDNMMFQLALHHLDDVQCKVRFISFEPLLDRIGDAHLVKGFDWVIIGAQTNPYKPPKIEWVEEIARACGKAGVAVFLKDNLKPLIQTEPYSSMFYSDQGMTLRQELPSCNK